ncbi:hypothetical protein [Spiroplasma ixodetis]|nr:hypothetical protein [Spiroplasma ixodetis]
MKGKLNIPEKDKNTLFKRIIFRKYKDEINCELLPTCTCGGNNEIEWVQ